MTQTDTQAQCSERVFHQMGFSGSWDQCARKAKIGAYCTQHDPVRVKARRQASTDLYNAEAAERREIHRRRLAEANACKGLNTEALEQGVVAELLTALESLVNEGDGALLHAEAVIVKARGEQA